MNCRMTNWNILSRYVCRTCHCLQTRRSIMVWEGHRKREYIHKFPEPSKLEKFKTGIKMLPSEFGQFGREVKDHFKPQHWQMEHGDYKYLWKLNDQSALDEWVRCGPDIRKVVNADTDMDAGSSTAEISLSKQKCMLFHGFLNTAVPDDGMTKYAGYVNIRSPYNFKSFSRLWPYDWCLFTHLVIRCRGDGRPYCLNLQMDNYFDVQWHDIYAFNLYTRGGPYWQIAKIPFTKFFLSNKGRIQDKQDKVNLEKIKNFAITLSDDAHGPFQLEIDYVGLVYDAHHRDKFFYEMYDNDPFLS